MLNTVIYARVSSDNQAKHGFSVEEQIRNCLTYAKENNLKIINTFTDDGISAKNLKRSGLTDLMDFCKNPSNNVKYVIIHSLDRISRCIKDYIADLVPFFEKCNIELIVVNGVNGNNLETNMQRKMSMVFAEYERELGIMRTKNALRGKVHLGQYPYPPPVGYKNILKKNARYKEMIIDEPMAYFIRKAYSMCLSGDSVSTITEKLYKLGFRNKHGNKHPMSTINHILHNITYTGKFMFEGNLIENTNYPAIIDDIIFYAVQNKLSAPNKTRQTHTKFTYTECIRCSVCGCQLTAELKKGKYVYYHCTGKKGGNCKKNSYIREEKIDSKMKNVLENLYIPEILIPEIEKKLNVIHKEKAKNKNKDLINIRKRISKIDKTVKDIFESGIASTEIAKEQILKLDKEKQMLLLEEKIQEKTRKDFSIGSNSLLIFCNKAFDIYKKGSAEQKRKIVQLISSNFSYDGSNLHLEPKPVFKYLMEIPKDNKKLPELGSNQQPTG